MPTSAAENTAAATSASAELLLGQLNYPAELPVVERRDELLEAISASQVLIVAGETGSGKSTQLPKLCLEAGRGREGLIGHTQPRRLAARSIAERLAEETETKVGDQIGFTVRFNDRVSNQTLIKVMTDGILLAELQRDRLLRRYDTLIIDEAHERSLNIDFILGYLKQLLPRRPDLKVIITSATIDTERFSEHFDNAPVVEVSGRSFPVETRYEPLSDPLGGNGLSEVDGICKAVTALSREGEGDMLVFLAGERNIREAADALSDLNLHQTEIFPLYARLSSAEQHRVFQAHKGRRIVLATNVAETSVTVPGIRYVIDPGNARISRFNQRTKVQRLPIEKISQASADQRAGRCGRIGPGICVRLYAEDDYDARPEFTDPEIRRTNLASVILQMASLGLGDVAAFPFLDPPDHRNIVDGINLLEELHALNPEHEFTKQWLTPTGRELAKLPIDPRFGRMILEAADNGGLNEVLIIVAGLSIQDPRERPSNTQGEADNSHARFADENSDFIALLNLWRYLQSERKKRSSNQFRRLCHREFINYNRVREWQDTHKQLRETIKDLGYTSGSNKANHDTIHRALLAGLLSHIGTKDVKHERKLKQDAERNKAKGRRRSSGPSEYLGARGSRFAIGRRSTLSKAAPKWLMAAELIETNRLWASMAAPIDPSWAESQAEHLLTYSYGPPDWNSDDGVATCVESATLYGLPLISGRRVTVGSVNPELARELFIHHALVESDWSTHHDFVNHNADLVADMEEFEARSRRRDLLVEQERLHAFFDQRLPSDVTSGAHFAAWWKTTSKTEPELFHLSIADLLEPDAAPIDPDQFPDSWPVGGSELELAYAFDAASHLDGISLHVPVELLPQLDREPFTWSVPGQRLELVAALLRSLPKDMRKGLTPVADTAAAIVDQLDPAEGGSITQSLAQRLGKEVGIRISVDDFDWDRVPEHLRLTFRVINSDRELLAEGKSLAEVQRILDDQSKQAVAELSAQGNDLERSGLRAWDFGDLPMEVTTETAGHKVVAYPSLVDDGDSVSIRYLTSIDERADVHWDAVRRLLRFRLPSPLRRLDRELSQQTKLQLLSPPAQSKAQWYDDAVNAVLDAIMIDFGSSPLTAAGFEQLTAHAADRFNADLTVAAHAVEHLVASALPVEHELDALSNASFDVSVRDASAHYRRLAFPGMALRHGLGRLHDVARYLDGLTYRLSRLAENPQLDLTKAADCVAVEQRYRELVKQLGPTDELDDIRWQIEELRILLFAQHLRASDAPKVSRQRIDRSLAAVARQGGIA